MIILGSNNNDKGKQLEQLTRELLNQHRFQNIAVNVVTSGGQEIDVTGEKLLSVPGSTKKIRLIAECKAYQAPVAMPHWLKFLGKVFAEECRLQKEVTGLFVALSGVNGNVLGSYDEIKQHRQNISLLTSDNLLKEVETLFNAIPQAEAIERLRTLTVKQHVSVDLAYYNSKVYWLFEFPGNEFACLGASGTFLSPEEASTLKPMIQDRIAAHTYVDLAEEERARQKMANVLKSFIARLANCGGCIDKAELITLAEGESIPSGKILKALAEFSWIRSDDEKVQFIEDPEDSEHQLQLLAYVAKFMFSGLLHSDDLCSFFCSEYVQSKIDDAFLNYVSKIQGDLPLPDSLKVRILQISKLSPSAFLRAITPVQLIVSHRTSSQTYQNMDEDDCKTLERELLDHLFRDFEQPSMIEYFFNKHQIREIETIQQYKVKSKSKLEIDTTVRTRHGIGRGDATLDNQYLRILLLDHIPEPWEPGGIGHRKPQITNDQQTFSADVEEPYDKD